MFFAELNINLYYDQAILFLGFLKRNKKNRPT